MRCLDRLQATEVFLFLGRHVQLTYYLSEVYEPTQLPLRYSVSQRRQCALCTEFAMWLSRFAIYEMLLRRRNILEVA